MFKSHLFLLFWSFFMLVACTDSSEQKLPPKRTDLPSRTIKNALLTMKDSGYARVKLKAPLIEEFGFIDTPYTVFPRGLVLETYKVDKKRAGFLRADWAKMVDKKGWYEAKGNIVIINDKGDTLKTHRIYWDKQRRHIYTHDSVKIIKADSTFVVSKGGLDATEDFKNFTLFQNHGEVMMKDKD